MNIYLIIIIILVMIVIFVNGWTDAPNAIATSISTRVLKPKHAIIIAIIMNFLGALIMTIFNSKVAETISNMIYLNNNYIAKIVLSSSLISIIIWAIAAWYFGIPTSESHSLIAGLTGSAFAFDGINSINFNEWLKVIIGLFISTIIGFLGGYIITKLIMIFFSKFNRQKIYKFCSIGQIFGAVSNSFLHGAQDGQKFMGVFMLILFYNNLVSKIGNFFIVPIWVMLLCSITIGLGTSVGGMKIIKSIGFNMVNLKLYQGFTSDLSSSICLFLASIFGIPVSTTHTKTISIMGAGAARKFSSVNWKIVQDMFCAWILTFPGCGIIAFLITKFLLFLK